VTTTGLAYRVLGTTDDVTECQCCGRADLKSTVMLGILDADGNVEEVTYFGSACGAKAAGWTTKFVRDAAKQADRERRAAEQARRDREFLAEIAARDAWIAANIGPDALDQPRRYGFSGPVAVVKAYRAAVGG
jgi:hypothetical protein